MTADDNTGYVGYSSYLPDASSVLQKVNNSFPTLDRATGFRLNFTADVDNEVSNPNRGGFNVILLSSDAKGVELAFNANGAGAADDYIFAQQPNFTGEDEKTGTNAVNIGNANNYALTILGDTYTLAVGGTTQLTGTVKSYSFNPATSNPPLPANPYTQPNLLFLGDNTDQARSDFALSNISITTLGDAPTASSVAVSGTLTVGETLTASYSYRDPNSDPEAGSTFQWFRASASAGTDKTVIPGATNDTYTVAAADLGKFLFFEVTPRDNTAQVGAPALSAFFPQPTPAPTPTPAPVPTPEPAPLAIADGPTGSAIIDGQPEPISFGPWVRPGARKTFAIPNTGTVSLTIDDLTVQGAPATLPDGTQLLTPFAIVGPSPSPVPAGQTATFEVVLDDRVSPDTYQGIVVARSGDRVFNFPVSALVPTIPTVPIASDPLPDLVPLDEAAGTSGDDEEILGGDGGQLIKGFQGNDRLFGNRGRDLLTGGDGDDSLYGGKDDDWLFGRVGDDLLSGDLGDDSLVGGPGADSFVLGADRGVDTIFDFEDDRDRLLLADGLGFGDLAIADGAGFATVQVAATGQAIGNIWGMYAAQLTAADFAAA